VPGGTVGRVTALPEGAVRLRGVSRRFRVLHERNLTLKETVLRRRRTRYSEFWALRDVDLDIAPGESLGVVGRNGSGKSTTLKLVAGIIEPSAGTITVGGAIASMLELGAGFHPDFSGRENLYLNASILGFSEREIDDLFDEIVAFAEMEDFIDSPVRTYSSGMQMRLAFSVASHVRADIMLLDEVFAVGDEAFQRKCMGRMFEFRRAGGTLVFVSHDAAAIERICDRAVLLEDGRVIADGPPGDVLSDYHRLLAESDRRSTTRHAEAGVTTPSDGPVAQAEDDGDGDPREDGASRNRWGSGDARIRACRLVRADGREASSFRSGDEMRVEVEFVCERPMAFPSFGMMIHSVEGVLCYGTNTGRESFHVDGEVTSGTVLMTFPRIVLHEGRFVVTVAMGAHDESVVYDWLDRWIDFSVFASGGGIGLVDLAGRWTYQRPGADPAGTATLASGA
jgi:ABC-type polysaccharide/polyol phosphate transport system ATPase subunit